MKAYRFESNWRSTVLAAIFVHFFVVLGAALAMPYLEAANDPLPVDEMTMVELGDGAEEETPGPQAPTPPQPQPMPQQPPPPVQPMPEEPDITEDVADLSPTEAQELEEAVADIQSQEAAAAQGGGAGKILPPAPPTQQIGALVVAGNTPDTSGTDFHGTIGILVFLDANGRITGYRMTQSSGRRFVDQIVINAVRRFTFEPALDTEGHPMKTMRLLKFPFDGSGAHPFDDDENKRIRTNKTLAAAQAAQQQP